MSDDPQHPPTDSTSIRKEIVRLLEESNRLKEQAKANDEKAAELLILVRRAEAQRNDSKPPPPRG